MYGLVACPFTSKKAAGQRSPIVSCARARDLPAKAGVSKHIAIACRSPRPMVSRLRMDSFEAQGERGDLYTHSPIAETRARQLLCGHA